MFSLEKPELTHVALHEFDMSDAAPMASKPYKLDKAKQRIIEDHVKKKLDNDVIMPIDSPFALSVVLCRKNNGKNPSDPEGWILQLITSN